MACDHKFVDSNSCLKCGWTPAETMAKNRLEMTALIEHDDEHRFAVWLCHDNPQDHPENHSFVAGSFDTFEMALGAINDIRGIRVERVLAGSKHDTTAFVIR